MWSRCEGFIDSLNLNDARDNLLHNLLDGHHPVFGTVSLRLLLVGFRLLLDEMQWVFFSLLHCVGSLTLPRLDPRQRADAFRVCPGADSFARHPGGPISRPARTTFPVFVVLKDLQKK